MTITTMQARSVAGDVVQLDAPPRVPDRGGSGGIAMAVLPMLGSLGSVALFAGAGGQSPTRYAAAGLLLLTTLTLVAAQLDRQRVNRGRRAGIARADYLRHLESVRRRARAAADAQREAALRVHPPPDMLPLLAAEHPEVRWRRPEDPDFLKVRWGVGEQPSALTLLPPDEHADDDPASAAHARRLVEVHRAVPGVPLSLDLRDHGHLAWAGPDAAARARALICSAVAAHHPDHLAVAVLADASNLGEWDWIKWLPHARSPKRHDAVGPARLVRCSWTELEELLAARGPAPHLLLVAPRASDDVPVAVEGRTVVALGGERGGTEAAAAAHAAMPDRCDTEVAEALARRLSRAQAFGARSGQRDVAELLCGGSADDRLGVPIGTDDDGVVVLDLEEAAHGGMGPHGLVIGATGSGKSELLRTIVLGLALRHPPERVNLVLIDYKGGATFAGLAELPHVSAVITNLDEDRALVERMQDALSGELVRRQQVLRASGTASRREHEESRRTAGRGEPLPALVVVVDEFSELLGAEPGLIDLFVSIGRLGRSLGIHLLLSSQRLEEGRLRGLDSHLSYRIGLRTFSAQESRTVIGVPDAYELPPVPGIGYLRTDPVTLRRFMAAYVSGPSGRASSELAGVLPFTLLEVTAPEAGTLGEESGESFLALSVRRMADGRSRAHRIWLPPLDAPAPLAGGHGLIDDLTHDPTRGLSSARWRSEGPLVVPIGTVDRPRDQRRDVLRVDLSGAGGHVAVVGAPRSGRTTLLQTLLLGLALTTTPQEAQVYLLDLGGGLAPLAGLPHHAGSAGRGDPSRIRRVVAEVSGILSRREAFFRSRRIDSIETYRHLRAAGEPGDGYGEVFLVVDGWGTLRAEDDDIEPQIAQLQTRGLGFGIHVIATALRWSEFRASTRDLFGTRLELRLGDPMDSALGRTTAARVPTRPGRGLTADGLHFLAAVPGREGGAPGPEELVAAVSDAWSGAVAPQLRVLPSRIRLDALHASGTAHELVLGLDEDLEVVRVDVAAEPHLLALGDRGSGRTTLLRGWCRQLVERRTPQEARLLVVDPRRTLLGEVPPPRLLGQVSSASETEQALTELAAYLSRRLPGPAVTSDQLRARSWWSGAEVFVVVDDYELLTAGAASPLSPLAPLMAHAWEVGLHLVLARRIGGAGRAFHDPILQGLRDLGALSLLLSGDPHEGPLLGGLRPAQAPPGRARLLTRDRPPRQVQLAWTDPSP